VGERQSSDGGGREFHRVAGELRTRMSNGTYPLHSMLPAQRDLADEFGVSRDTVQRVLRELAEAGWVESRQGRGSRVVRVPQATAAPVVAGQSRGPITLGPALGRAFERPEVVLDTYTLTSESLYTHFSVQVERIRAGAIAPERVAVRMILPAEDLPLPFPRARHDKDDPRLSERLNAIQRRSLTSLEGLFSGLELEDFVPSVSLEVRRARMAPSHKLYLLNGAEALLAPYEVVERDIRLEGGEVVPAASGSPSPTTSRTRTASHPARSSSTAGRTGSTRCGSTSPSRPRPCASMPGPRGEALSPIRMRRRSAGDSDPFETANRPVSEDLPRTKLRTTRSATSPPLPFVRRPLRHLTFALPIRSSVSNRSGQWSSPSFPGTFSGFDQPVTPRRTPCCGGSWRSPSPLPRPADTTTATTCCR
jgi:hypothetical protein